MSFIDLLSRIHFRGLMKKWMSPPSERRLWWLMVVLVGVFLVQFIVWPNLFRYVGVVHYRVWFIDTYAILASNEAAEQGIDPYIPNPLDIFRRSHVYPHWWLGLSRLGLTREDCAWLGFSLGAVFFLAVIARLRPRSPPELLWYMSIFCSPPILLGLERANNDLVIFLVLAPVVSLLMARSEAVRLLAVPLIAIAAALKTYPIVAGLVLLACDDWRELLRRLLLFAAFITLIGLDLVSDWPKFGRLVPQAHGLLSFGASDVLVLAGVEVARSKMIMPIAGALAFGVFLRWNGLVGWTARIEDRAAWLSFVLGAVLLTGCFFAGTSFAYRWIYTLWLAPLTWQMISDPGLPRRHRLLAKIMAISLVIALWSNGAAIAFLTWCLPRFGQAAANRWSGYLLLAQQPVIWIVFLSLLTFLAHFLRESVQRHWKPVRMAIRLPRA